MNKKVIVLGVVLIALASLGIVLLQPAPAPLYSDSPEDWIAVSGDSRTLDIYQMTEGQTEDLGDAVEFTVDGESRRISNEGFYEGNHFVDRYPLTDEPLIRFSSRMDPSDGVMEVFVAEKTEGDVFKVFILLDEDWRAKLPATNVIWGAQYQNEQAFVFDEVQPGVYLMEIEDDPSRFSFGIQEAATGIIVGGVTREQVLAGVTQGVTAIVFQ